MIHEDEGIGAYTNDWTDACSVSTVTQTISAILDCLDYTIDSEEGAIIADGISHAYREGHYHGFDDGCSAGYDEGYEEGYNAGLNAAIEDGR